MHFPMRNYLAIYLKLFQSYKGASNAEARPLGTNVTKIGRAAEVNCRHINSVFTILNKPTKRI